MTAPIGMPGSARTRHASVSISSPPQNIPLSQASLISPPLASSPPGASYFASSTSPLNSFTNAMSQSLTRVLHPLGQSEVKILLLENISQGAKDLLLAQGYQVDHYTKAWSEEELLKSIGDYHAIGIRSKTKITAPVLKAAQKLVVIGCFCIGTNQVDLKTAASSGVAVFNSPFSNSRSVAELVISEVIALSRQLFERSSEMHQGVWNKVSKGCWEVRGKTLGIIGYGHIGTQLSVLSEALGMQVIYYDVLPIMPLGSAKQVDTLEDLLQQADFVTLHVPELPETKNLISTAQLDLMKDGAYLINNSRGRVVDIPALCVALEQGHLAGAAIDVFPHEPGSNGPGFVNSLNGFESRLAACKNVILTPHIGGSTEEAQSLIGIEVGTALTRYINYGSSVGAVNFPEVDLRGIPKDPVGGKGHVRVCHVHENRPGVLRGVNAIFEGAGNVEKQFSDSKGDIAYLMADISGVDESQVQEIFEAIQRTKSNILTRLLY